MSSAQASHVNLYDVGMFVAGAQHTAVKKLGLVVGVMALSGTAAGLLGIGGALIFNPFLLNLGVHPQVIVKLAWFAVCPHVFYCMHSWTGC